MTKIPFELTIHLPAKGLDEGADVDLFLILKRMNNCLNFKTL